MSFTADDVKKLADLARIDFSDEEIAKLGQELDAIVHYVEQLSEVDTDGVEPVAQVTGLVNVVRQDEQKPMFSIQETLANAPQANEVAFLVPKAVER